MRGEPAQDAAFTPVALGEPMRLSPTAWLQMLNQVQPAPRSIKALTLLKLIN